jgi:hypothetical protein
MASIYVAGIGMTVSGRDLGRTLDDLAGEAGARQATGARAAMQENGGGLAGAEEAAVAIHILTR